VAASTPAGPEHRTPAAATIFALLTSEPEVDEVEVGGQTFYVASSAAGSGKAPELLAQATARAAWSTRSWTGLMRKEIEAALGNPATGLRDYVRCLSRLDDRPARAAAR
jgi:hypothetical protein